MKPIKYTCRKCGATNAITSFWQWFCTPHFGSRKWLRCYQCEMKNFMPRRGWTGPKWLDWPGEWNNK